MDVYDGQRPYRKSWIGRERRVNRMPGTVTHMALGINKGRTRLRRATDKTPKRIEGDIVFYRTPEGTTRIEVLYESETFWLNQKKIAELFGVELHTISYHLKEIYASGELSEPATLRKIRRVHLGGDRADRRRDHRRTIRCRQTVHGPHHLENAPAGKILKSDVVVGKNYLIEGEIKELKRIVGMYIEGKGKPGKKPPREKSE